MPLVALTGPVVANAWQSGINAGLAATVVMLAWWAAGRIGVERIRDRVALVLLLGFSTQVWWVTTRGGVWHTGHLVAMILTLLLLAELFGRRRAVLMGLLVGAAFLTRAPVAFAAPAVALWLLAASPAVEAGRRSAERDPPAAMARLGAARARPRAGPGVLLLVQPRPLRLAARVRVRAGHPAGLAGGPAQAGAVLAGARADERGLPVPQAAGVHRRVPVLPAGWPGHVGAVHEPGPAAGGTGTVAGPRARGSCWWQPCWC